MVRALKTKVDLEAGIPICPFECNGKTCKMRVKPWSESRRAAGKAPYPFCNYHQEKKNRDADVRNGGLKDICGARYQLW